MADFLWALEWIARITFPYLIRFDPFGISGENLVSFTPRLLVLGGDAKLKPKPKKRKLASENNREKPLYNHCKPSYSILIAPSFRKDDATIWTRQCFYLFIYLLFRCKWEGVVGRRHGGGWLRRGWLGCRGVGRNGFHNVRWSRLELEV